MDKQQARQIIKETFENPFDKGRFTGFIKNLLNRIDEGSFIYKGNYIPDAYKQYVKTLERIGKFSDGENSLDILVITLQKDTSLERARTMQRNFIAWYLNGSRGGEMKDAALAAYVAPDQGDWRFSLVKMDYKFEKGKSGKVKVKEEFTPARRWSFLVGANEKSHTAQSRLVNILADDKQAPTFAELENAFDIETVTKEFFLKYRELFLRTKEALDKVVRKDPKTRADFEAKGVDTVNFAKKLLGQIVFLYFLQKKGWFGVGRDDDWGTGSKHFLRQLFEKHKSDTGIPACNSLSTDKNVCATIGKNFFNDILEPLFYEALRIDRSHDDDYYSRFNCKIPFLNGGLFDPIGNYDWEHTDINLPNDLFSNSRQTKEGDTGDGILDVFDRYNFTVREDEPLEKEVAIDPELLGKAYEKFNTIRPDNFDEFTQALKSGKTGEENKFNKKFGVYYTPREIVHYMCKQSLINYLYTVGADGNPPIKKEDIEDLIEVGEMITEHEATALIKQENIRNGIQKSTEYTALLSDSIRANAAAIDQWLEEITVCDPAVGSGAFPVGMMNEIVRARNVLSIFLKGKGNTDIPVCDDDRVTITRRNLPHWTKEGSIYWITFRLADSLPQEKLNAWKAERDYWISKHPKPWSETEWKEYDVQFGKRLEGWLDSGHGSCELAKPEIRKILQECLFRFNGERLLLHAGVIMPNHVHLLLEPLAGNSLSELLKGIKGASSRKTNQILGTTGNNFWMDESYDHIVRSEDQYQHFIQYIVDNPVKANLSDDKYWLYSSTGIPACDEIQTQTGMSVPRSDYEFKRRCIEHSLYGVDIDPGAVEIAKLRLWLSLVVDEEDIKNIKPLPNLDYKIVCGNSLLDVEKDLFNLQFFNDLEKLKPLFFKETNPTKKQEYKKQIDGLINQITNGHTEFDFEVYFSEVFHEKGGFDVVIANPPYIVLTRNALQNFNWVKGNQNTYVAFLEVACKYINDNGSLAYIIPSTWLAGNNFKNLRLTLLKNRRIQQIIQLPYDIFDAAYVDNVIVVITGQDINNEKTKTFKFEIRDTVHQEIQFQEFDVEDWLQSPDSAIYLEKSLQRILDIYQATPYKLLGEIANVQRGTLPPKETDLLSSSECMTTQQNLVRWFTGQVYRYLIVKGPERFVIYKKLKENKSLEVFSGSRILGRQLVSRQFRLQFNFVTEDFAFKKNLYAIYDCDNNLAYSYLLAILNSRFFSYIQVKLNASGQRDDYPAFSLKDFRNFKMPIISPDEQKPFINLVDKILTITKGDDYLQNPAKQAQVKDYEKQIDQMVYELYGLTEEEIKIVEGETA